MIRVSSTTTTTTITTMGRLAAAASSMLFVGIGCAVLALAFTPVPESTIHHPRRTYPRVVMLHTSATTQSSSTSSPSSPPSYFKSKRLLSDDLLEDERGRINAELAQRLWKWEQQQRLNLDILGDYSTRRGLRWVKDLVESKHEGSARKSSDNTGNQEDMNGRTSTSRTRNNNKNDSTPNYDDLIQEGIIGLMQSLKYFEHQARPNESFESFAKTRIQHALDSYMLERERGSGETLGMTQSQRHPLSMESTVAVMADPLEEHNYYYNQDEWEVREGLVLDNGHSLRRDELVEDFMDENMRSEGDDQMWVHEQQVAAPLRDSIPAERDDLVQNDDDDGGVLSSSSALTSPEDLVLKDLLLHNVDDFLNQSTLDDLETQVIQMQFGLDDGVPKPQREIAVELDLTVNQVRKMKKRALTKLRATFTDKYVSDDTSQEDYWEDTP